jgi:flavin reductase (DIM6/NTAB) family NADH-FMN oxidoreductase RutF
MACIGGDKLTKDRIRANGVFSANLVSEKVLSLADYYGNTEGYDPKKMEVQIETMPGAVLPVPVLKDSPWSFELEVKKTVMLEGSEVFLCRVRNILADEELLKDNLKIGELMTIAAPVITTKQTYFDLKGNVLGGWGEPGSKFKER